MFFLNCLLVESHLILLSEKKKRYQTTQTDGCIFALQQAKICEYLHLNEKKAIQTTHITKWIVLCKKRNKQHCI